jgi:hypothetical protein
MPGLKHNSVKGRRELARQAMAVLERQKQAKQQRKGDKK